MVRLENGSIVLAAELLNGQGTDDEGNKIDFKEVEGVGMPTYTADFEMKDGSGRTKTYSFSLADTAVRVDVGVGERTVEREEREAREKEEQEKRDMMQQNAQTAEQQSQEGGGGEAKEQNTELVTGKGKSRRSPT